MDISQRTLVNDLGCNHVVLNRLAEKLGVTPYPPSRSLPRKSYAMADASKIMRFYCKSLAEGSTSTDMLASFAPDAAPDAT